MDFALLSHTPLFAGVAPQDIEAMLACLDTERRHYAKGQVILHSGDTVRSMGIVLSGRVLIEKTDLWGNATVLDSVGPGQIFAETYACTPQEPLMVDAVAAESSQVLFIQVARVLEVCPNSCAHHHICHRYDNQTVCALDDLLQFTLQDPRYDIPHTVFDQQAHGTVDQAGSKLPTRCAAK